MAVDKEEPPYAILAEVVGKAEQRDGGDYASHWIHRRAAELGVSRAFLALFNAAWLSFIGPLSSLIDGLDGRSTAEEYTVVPKWSRH